METQTLDTRALNLAAPMRHHPFRTAAVLGAGTMGAQIAAHLANAGLQVYLLDIAPDDEDDPNAVVNKGFKQARQAKPDPFFTDEAAQRIRRGNFRGDFEWVAQVDWVIEAVVERMDVKRKVMARLEETVREDAVVSTNTSGLPIHEITEGRAPGFRQRVLGTHFFNPPRYLKLLELIPTEATDSEVVERVAQFGRIHLGKGIVVANDVPYFIGNRIGVYGQLQAVRHFTDGDYTIEEIDTLTGPLVGRPKSATFRTADLVGLDVLRHVAENLYEKVPRDERREAFRTPALLDRLVEKGALGEKTKAGFYKKEDNTIKSVNPETGAYEAPAEQQLGDLERIRQAGDLTARLRALYEDEGRAGAFFRDTTLDLLGYSALRLGEITDNPADVDRAIRWGFGWEQGPFQMWDTIGFETVLNGMNERGIEVPDWVEEMRKEGRTSFYRTEEGARTVYLPEQGGYAADSRPDDEIELASVRAKESRTLWENKEAALLDIGEGVALYEFRSKANTLGERVMQGLVEVIGRVESDRDLRGLVVGNEGKNFSVGANLAEIAGALQEGQFDQIEEHIIQFQQAVQRVRYAEKPVVVAAHQRVLGGGCEMVMACPHPVASAETYMGLVELGVGLIPAGTGTTRLAIRAANLAQGGHANEIQSALRPLFENVAMAEVAESARQAQEMRYLPGQARIVMHPDRRLYVAREEVLRLSNEGYMPPPPRTHVKVLGRPTRAAFAVAVQQYLEGGFISAYDKHLTLQLAYVMTGGDLSGPQEVHEDYLIDLEREVFMRLLGEEKTQDRIRHMLEKGKPLRN